MLATHSVFVSLARGRSVSRLRPAAGRIHGGAMKVRDILGVKGDQVYSVSPQQTMQDVVRVLMAHRIGAALVVDDDGQTVGIVTERDVLRECLDGADRLERIPVRDAMTRDLIIGTPSNDLDEAMQMMTSHRIRHLPIIDGGQLAGMISIGDVVKATLDETAFENGFLREYIQGR
jgi:CBS domain-containing protein